MESRLQAVARPVNLAAWLLEFGRWQLVETRGGPLLQSDRGLPFAGSALAAERPMSHEIALAACTARPTSGGL